jgi:hypothetical protein
MRFSLILLVFLMGCEDQKPVDRLVSSTKDGDQNSVDRLISSTKDGVSFFYESLNSNLIKGQQLHLDHLGMEVRFEGDTDWVELELNETQSRRFLTVLKQIRFLDENEMREREESFRKSFRNGEMPMLSLPSIFCSVSIPVHFPKEGRIKNDLVIYKGGLIYVNGCMCYMTDGDAEKIYQLIKSFRQSAKPVAE